MKSILYSLFVLFNIVAIQHIKAQDSFKPYNESEIRQLQDFLRQPAYTVPAVCNLTKVGLTIADTATWDSDTAWIKKITNVTWVIIDTVKRVQKIEWTNKGVAGKINLSNFNALTDLTIIGAVTVDTLKRITNVNLTGCVALSTINLNNQQLTSLDLSACDNITSIQAISRPTAGTSQNQITSIDVHGKKLLTALSLTQNALTYINIDSCIALRNIQVGSNQLKTLDISTCPEMTANKNAQLNVSNNFFKFSTLPKEQIQLTYTYSPQYEIDGEKTPVNKIIDLSSEYSITRIKGEDTIDQITKYVWFDITNTTDTIGIDTLVTSIGKGKFTLDTSLERSSILCKMTNNNFMGLTIGYKTVVIEREKIAVVSITINLKSDTLEVGEEVTLNATVLPEDADNKKVTWVSGDESIATVDLTGKVKAIAVGTVSIVATTEDGGYADTCIVKVIDPIIHVTGITLNKKIDTLDINDEITLTVIITPENANNKNVTWGSSNTTIATVDATGKVKAIAAGTTSIIVKTEDGNYTDTCMIVVNRKTGIVEQTIESIDVKMYPNPAKDKIYIQTEGFDHSKAQVEIYSVGGQIVLKQDIRANGGQEISLKTIATGIYYVKVFDNQSCKVTKLVIQ